MGKTLIIAGLVLVLAGLLWPWLSRIPFGRLPGDLVWGRGSVRVYFPVMTCLVISLILSVLFYLFRR